MKKTIAVFALALSALTLTGCTDEEAQHKERSNAYEAMMADLGIPEGKFGIMLMTAWRLCDDMDDLPKGSERRYDLIFAAAEQRTRIDRVSEQDSLVAMTEAPTILCPQHSDLFD